MGSQIDRQVPEIRHLSKTDPVMERLIRDIGPYRLTPRIRRSPFESLARAIAYQQLHEKAAESILRRFMALFPTGRFPQAGDLLAMNEQAIRGAGFSQAKVVALRDLAAKTLDGTVPTGAIVRKLDDEAIIERLIAVRGIGRWTVEMLLIFQLGRPDVLPVRRLRCAQRVPHRLWSAFDAEAERGATLWGALEALSHRRSLVSLADGRSAKEAKKALAGC